MRETSLPTNRAGLAALITIVWGLVMAYYVGQYPYPHVFNHDVDSPVVALELSRGQRDIDKVLHRRHTESPTTPKSNPAVQNMALLNWLDLAFIPLYTFSIWSLARVFATRTRRLAILVAGVAVFDYLEDGQIFRALAGQNPPIFIPSLIKWGLLGVVFLVLSRILLISKSAVYRLPTKRLMAIAYFAAGVVILARRGFRPMDWLLPYRVRRRHILGAAHCQCGGPARTLRRDSGDQIDIHREFLRATHVGDSDQRRTSETR